MLPFDSPQQLAGGRSRSTLAGGRVGTRTDATAHRNRGIVAATLSPIAWRPPPIPAQRIVDRSCRPGPAIRAAPDALARREYRATELSSAAPGYAHRRKRVSSIPAPAA